MAGIIDYINDSGQLNQKSNTNMGIPRNGTNGSKSYSSYFNVTTKGKPLDPADVKPVENVSQIKKDYNTSEDVKLAYAGQSSSYPKSGKPIINTETGKSFATASVSPIKEYTMDNCITKLNKTLNIRDDYASVYTSFKNLTVSKYNRYKLPNYNEVLSRGFPHVFFVRPDCNIITPQNNKSGVVTLSKANKFHDLFQYAAKANPEILQELSLHNGRSNTDFMLSLSNRTISFNANDEAIETADYGTTYTGYKIAYGKNDIKSKTAGQLSIQVKDDRNFYIYQLIRCWVEYISGVYRGEMTPTQDNIINKILDYTSAIYYIITAEDGETILFWSKYYGVFPTSIPATQYSWAAGNTIFSPELNVEFQYSFKKDFSPELIVEFNHNARVFNSENKESNYESNYDPFLNSVGRSWVGDPFIEVANNSEMGGNPYELKLRFRKMGTNDIKDKFIS